jgi:anti-sigma regulatory factor (Ser/Thr protein kinase)
MATEESGRHSLTLDSTLASAGKGSEWARALAERSGLPEEQVGALDLCIIELVSNIVMHSYRGSPGEIRLDLELDDDGAMLTITDNGPAFDPLSVPMPAVPASLEEAKIGGNGIHLVRSSADACLYRRRDGRNIFIACFGSPPPTP